MCPYDSVFEIFEQIIQHILFLGTSPRKRMQFLAALESSKRELTEMPYFKGNKDHYAGTICTPELVYNEKLRVSH